VEVSLIQVPYDSGIYNKRMGRGPFFLVEHGIVDTIGASCHSVESVVVESDDSFPTEVGTTFRLLRATAEEVRRAVERGRFPLVLAGNCITTVGAVSGLMPRDVGLIWFDAHGDFHTPETSPSGFLDAMAISIGVGHCWRTLAESIPHYEALPEDRVLLVGARDFG
jgi:arginase